MTMKTSVESLGASQCIEGELVRRNREIAQVRDKLQKREKEIEDWKRRHNDLVKHHVDMDGEMTKLRIECKAHKRFQDAAIRSEVDAAKSEADELKRRLVSSEAAREVAEAAVRQFADLEERLLADQHSRLERFAALEQDVIASQAALRDAEAARDSAEGDAEEAERKLAKALRDTEDAERRLARLAGELEASKAREAELIRKKEEAERRCHETSDTERTLRKVRRDLAEAVDRAATLEKELAAEKCTGAIAKLEAKVRILHSENRALRSEAAAHRRKQKELGECLGMSCEEVSAHRVEASLEIARLNSVLEETRRARSLELHALISKLSRTDEKQGPSPQMSPMVGATPQGHDSEKHEHHERCSRPQSRRPPVPTLPLGVAVRNVLVGGG